MDYFNYTITRNAITAFMDFFAKFNIEKYETISNSAISGDTIFVRRKIIPVPIQFSSREKFVEIVRSSASRRAMDPSIRDKNPVEMMWILPRISCNLLGVTYDASRRLQKTQQVLGKDPNYSLNTTYTPAPYNLELEISTISRHIDDNLQLMEQILPYFAPTLNFTLNLHDGNPAESVPITLNSVSVDIPTDLPEFEERVFTNVYTFTMKLNYYMVQRLRKYITNINLGFNTGSEVIEINKQWVEIQNKIITKFNFYQNNTTMYNPLIYTDNLTSEAISALGSLPISANINDNKIYLSTPELSISPYYNLFYLYYRIDNNEKIYRYTDPISISNITNTLYYWLEYSPNTSEAAQFQVYSLSI